MEIFLSCTGPDLQTALHFKQDLQAQTSLFVALDHEDWVEDFEFEDKIHQAEVLLTLETETSDIAAWLIDNKPHRRWRRSPPIDISVVPAIDIENFYQAALETLLGLIAEKKMYRNYPPRCVMSEEEEDENEAVRRPSRAIEPDNDASTSKREDAHGAPRFANSNMDRQRRPLGRTEALKARKEKRDNRKSLRREASAQRIFWL